MWLFTTPLPSTDYFVPTSLPTDDVANTGIVSTSGTISHGHIAGFVHTDISLTTNIVPTDGIIDNDVGDLYMPTSKIKVVSDISSMQSDSVSKPTNTDLDFTVPRDSYINVRNPFSYARMHFPQ